MRKRRTPYQRRRRREWHPAVEWLHVPLIALVFLVSLPVMLPVALAQHGLTERRKRRTAQRTPCARCGAVLGAEALTRADAQWAEHVDKLFREHPGIRFRLVRRVWAVCAACGQRYDYGDAEDRFMILPEEPGRQGHFSA